LIEIERKTKETEISLKLELYGKGEYNIETGVGFFDHMLQSLSKHAFLNLELKCRGDLYVDHHHTVEDVGIVLGQALNKSLFPVQNIERFSNAVCVMDESSVECDMDVSNRPFLVYELDIDGKVGEFDCELFEEFFRALVFNSGLSVHLVKKRGKNRHHIAEAAFKAFALALRRAVKKTEGYGVPSTKGSI